MAWVSKRGARDATLCIACYRAVLFVSVRSANMRYSDRKLVQAKYNLQANHLFIAEDSKQTYLLGESVLIGSNAVAFDTCLSFGNEGLSCSSSLLSIVTMVMGSSWRFTLKETGVAAGVLLILRAEVALVLGRGLPVSSSSSVRSMIP